MTDEYAIDAPSFARTLRDQRRTRMKGGLYHLNQVLMAYNSNRIEGSRLNEEQTRFIYETRTITGENVAVDDVVEAVNSFELFDEMIDRLGEPITAEMMKDYHRILKQTILPTSTTGSRASTRSRTATAEWGGIAADRS